MKIAVSFLLFTFVVSSGIRAEEPAGTKAAEVPFDPTDQYEKRELEGWKLLVNKKLLVKEQDDLREKTLRLLQDHLYRITRVVPPGPLEKLRQIPIWVELNNPKFPCMCHHESEGWLRANNVNPEKVQCVELANCKNFLSWTNAQPWMVLHELAHGYHNRFLKEHDAEIKATWQKAMDAKLYDTVLHIDGRKVSHYAKTNHMEYFAESTEAFFGTNDFYPFVRAELKEHDPEMYKLMQKLWESK